MSTALESAMAKVTALKAQSDAIQAKNDATEKRVADLAKPVYPANANPNAVLPAHGPSIRSGENILGSRGFSFLRLAGALSRKGHDQAKIEMEVHQRLQKSLCEDLGAGRGYIRSGGGRTGGIEFNEGVMCPFGMDYLPQDVIGQKVMHEIKSLTFAGVENADPEQMVWLREKMYNAPGQKANQSYLNETAGGALIAPPEYGELIQLFRNKEALINAGVRTIPLPPQGSIVMPRQTSPTTGYYIGENNPITASNFGTGSFTLRAKKVAALCTLPNELIRFGGPAAEALLREDLSKTLALTMDYYLLSQGGGGDVVPQAILNTSGVTALAPAAPNAFAAQDIYKFPSSIMANNGRIEGYIMRPETFWAIQSNRTGTGAGPGTGLFMFNPTRGLDDKMSYIVGGLPTVLTPQVSNTRPLTVGGAAANATYILGAMFSDYLLAMFGSIEFAATAVGDTTFAQDQTTVRAILSHDGGMQHPGVFSYMDSLTSFTG